MANKSFGGHLYGQNASTKLALLDERSQSLLEAFEAMWKPGFKASSSARRMWDFVPIEGGGRPLMETELRAVGLATREMFWRHIERSEKAGTQYLERCIVASELMSPKLYGFEVYEDDFSSTDWSGARLPLFSAYECSALDEVASGEKAGPRRSSRI